MLKKIFIGVFAGLVSGFFASGGGMIVVPALIYLLGFDEKKARATSLFSIMPMVVTSGFFYMKSDFFNWEIGIKCAIGGVIGGYIGSKLLKKLSNKVLKIFFAFFLSYISIKMIFF